jgi:plasmid replication initiation protein
MEEVLLRQSNRFTTAKYELSLVEKRVYYFVIKEVRRLYVLEKIGDTTLFNNLIIKIPLTKLSKELKYESKREVVKSLKSLRLREFEYLEGSYDDDSLDWFVCGFIDWARIKKGVADIQISSELLPFLVALSEQYTEYSLTVAMSLRGIWSQRMYELCSQWRSAGGFRISVKDLREQFMLEEKYDRYASFKERVLDSAHKELKALYDAGQSDLYFEYTEEKNGRTVDNLRFKVVSKDGINTPNSTDLLRKTVVLLQELFEVTKKKKNSEYISKVLTKLQSSPDLIVHAHKRITEILASGISEPTRLIRFVLDEDILKVGKKVVGKEKQSKNQEKAPQSGNIEDFSRLSNEQYNDFKKREQEKEDKGFPKSIGDLLSGFGK